MSVEIEAKWVDVNFKDLRDKLLKLGAKLIQPERLMRRVAYDFSDKKIPSSNNAWLRVRDEGDKITLSYKQVNDRSILGTNEITITVDNFEQANEFVRILGFIPKSYQETMRETWSLGDSEITLDQWPWLPIMIEIEAASEDEVWNIALALGLDKNKAMFGSVENVYPIYFDVQETDVIKWPEIKFGPVPQWLEDKRRQ